MLTPLGFRFDVDTVLIGGVAHRSGCRTLPRSLPAAAITIATGEVYRAVPGECRTCQPPFETLLGYELEPIGSA